MPTYERATRVRAPLDEVWSFYSRVSGLEALTPDWVGLRVEAVRGPAGDLLGPEPGVLEAGTEISLSVRPLGVGPRVSWTSRIVERERIPDAARFRDEMVEGPFDRWRHTHTFVADGAATIVRDRVEYDLPLGCAGSVAGPIARLGFEPMFRHRHRETRRLFEHRPGRNDSARR